MTTDNPPFTHQRHFYLGAGTNLIRYQDGTEKHYSSMPEHGRSVHVSFESLLWLSLVMLFWGAVIYAAIVWGL